MAEISSSRVWLMRVLFLTLGGAIILLHLLPLDTLPRRIAPPDFLMAMTFAWSLRRPDYVPLLALAGIMLLADLLLQRPPGLMAALVVFGNEYLKNRFARLSEASFAGEWVSVGIVMAAIAVAYRLILTLFGIPLPPLAPALSQLILTLAIYPLVVVISHFGLGVRKLLPGDADAIGGRP